MACSGIPRDASSISLRSADTPHLLSIGRKVHHWHLINRAGGIHDADPGRDPSEPQKSCLPPPCTFHSAGMYVLNPSSHCHSFSAVLSSNISNSITCLRVSAVSRIPPFPCTCLLDLLCTRPFHHQMHGIWCVHVVFNFQGSNAVVFIATF